MRVVVLGDDELETNHAATGSSRGDSLGRGRARVEAGHDPGGHGNDQLTPAEAATRRPGPVERHHPDAPVRS
ncbi:hypothetical protein [Paractinoplanes hotanensis]|uniref:Uncharacterized protein n=1 Tax=Paractinoplanes hotanensis TaxID=2906497 RepID=A0ABT0Y3T2_9ACTN|nr:hypothetical protein [Actinoplanes hotanensis]MCM4080695.1 hypothetical protein [Actinoplanes hotanensis]